MTKTTKPGLTPEQTAKLQEEMRENQMIGKRATIAINLLPHIIRACPELTEEEMVEKATRITELAMDKLLGVKFTPNE